MSKSLAIKYRPKTFDEVVEQSATKVILQQQLDTGDIKNAYLFCGGSGTGKTTTARIFASELNKGKGTPIELDAASNNSVDDVREIVQQSKTLSLDSEYKVFIMDEVHALSNNAWQAMLKVLEEPPKKSIFIMCTTDPQKIPKTIHSRVQRYPFQCISTQGIIDRLNYVIKCENENGSQIHAGKQDIEFIAKLANGHLRDALTMLDKCLSYTNTLSIDEITEALGISDYECMMKLLSTYNSSDTMGMIEVVNSIYMSGKDLKQFLKDFTNFVLDCCKYDFGIDSKYLGCPVTDNILSLFKECGNQTDLLSSLINLQNDIKWDTNPKPRVEAWCITKE